MPSDPHHKHEAGANWIVVAVEDRADSESVIAYAMEEAALRNAAVLAVGVEQNEYRKASYDALDRRVAKLKQRYPSSQIFPVVTGDDITGYLADNSDEVVQQNLSDEECYFRFLYAPQRIYASGPNRSLNTRDYQYAVGAFESEKLLGDCVGWAPPC